MTIVSQTDREAAMLACLITGWKGVAGKLEQGWEPEAGTAEANLLELFARHRINSAKPTDAGVEQLRDALEKAISLLWEHCEGLAPRIEPLEAALSTPQPTEGTEDDVREALLRAQWVHDRTHKEDVAAWFREVLAAEDPMAHARKLTGAYRGELAHPPKPAEGMVNQSVYENAVKGRQDFRNAYRELLPVLRAAEALSRMWRTKGQKIDDAFFDAIAAVDVAVCGGKAKPEYISERAPPSSEDISDTLIAENKRLREALESIHERASIHSSTLARDLSNIARAALAAMGE